MLTIITPTSDRPRAFELCERWMSQQTYAGPLHWIVVDDGTEKVTCTMGQDHVHRPAGDHPHASFLGNLLAGFRRAESFGAQKICIIEDDDWYSSDYLQQMADWLDEYDLCGQGRARYYNLQTRRFKVFGNTNHASLCQTGFRGELLRPVIQWIESGRATRVLDTEIWKRVAAGRTRYVAPASTLSCGIKGLPGKGGLGYGHRMHSEQIDQSGDMLRQWVGEDAAVYKQLMEAA